ADSSVRLRALAALVAAGDSEVLSAAGQALRERTKSRDFPGQVLAALGRLDDPRVARVVLDSYVSLQADAQPKAVELLTQRAAWARQLMEAVGAGKLPSSVLNVNQVQKLLSLNDQELIAAVSRHWGTIRTSRDPARDALVGEMRKLI